MLYLAKRIRPECFSFPFHLSFSHSLFIYSPRETHASNGHSLTPNSPWGYLIIPPVEYCGSELEEEEAVVVERERYRATLAAHTSA